MQESGNKKQQALPQLKSKQTLEKTKLSIIT